MKKWTGLFALLALVLLFSACGAAPSSAPAPPVSASEEKPPLEKPKEAESQLFDQAEIRAQFEQAVAACSDVIDGLVIDMEKGAFPLPTPEEYARMSEAMGALDLPVSCYDLDMQNYDKVELFWNEAQQGKDAQVVIYCLHNWGITADILTQKDGEIYYTGASYDYPQIAADGKSSVQFQEQVYEMENLRMTEKGYLIGFIPEQNGYSEMYHYYRVLPINPEYRAYGKKYLTGIGYMPDNLLRYDWNKDDFTQLNMNWVFDSLYYKRNGDSATTIYTALDEKNRTRIPADVMETVMLGSLPITKEQLRNLIFFDEAKKEYAYRPFAGGGYSPTPEVVAAVQNEDGSLSLTVDAVTAEFGEDRSMSSILTVIDYPDGGFRYLSNAVVWPIEGD